MFVQKVAWKTNIYNQMNQSICGNANGVCMAIQYVAREKQLVVL